MEKYKTILIKTPVDKLVDLVRKKGKISLSEAIEVLGIPEKQIEEWVRVLEEHGIVELRYPALGEPEIVLKEIPKEKIVEKEEELEKGKKKIEEETEVFEGRTAKVEEKIITTNKSYLRLEKELKKKLEELEENLKKLKEYDTEKEKILGEAKKLETVSEGFAKQYESVESSFEEMDQKIKEQMKRLEGHEGEIKNLEEMKKKIEEEMIFLDKEMKIFKSLIKKPIKLPMLDKVKKLFERHTEKSEKIKAQHKGIHEKVLETKKILKDRKDHLKGSIKKGVKAR